MMTIGQADFDILAAIIPIVNALARLGTRYALTGSLAAVAHGVGRAVGDVDLVAELSAEQTTELTKHLLPRYVVDQGMVERALSSRTSFPLLDLTMLLKVDIVLPHDRALDRSALDRARPTTIAHDVSPLPLITPEDLILFKLERAAAIWPWRGDDWYDLQYLLKFCKDLDHAYLDAQAAALGWMRGLTTARTVAQTEPLALDMTLEFDRRMLDGAWGQQHPPLVYVEGARRDRIMGVAYERQRDQERHSEADPLTLALDALKWRYWDCDDPDASERLVAMVAAHAGLEVGDVAQR
jgi:hypothetical protein